MAQPGLPRKVDHLGRVVLPVEYRRALSINDGDEVAIEVVDDALVLRPVSPQCGLCGALTDLRPFKRRHICGDSALELGGN